MPKNLFGVNNMFSTKCLVMFVHVKTCRMVRLQVLTAANMKMHVFWVVAPVV
jgi:hypothetical protein